MSSTYKSPSTVDAQAHSSRELADDLGLNNNSHLPNTPFEQSHLSPYYSHTGSNSASPYNIHSTPGESISEYSNYQPSEFSEIEDPFFGVDFSAGVQRTDSLQAAISGNIAYQPPAINQYQQDLPPQAEQKSASDTLTTSTYPLSPRHTSIANTPSPRSEANDLKTKITISQHELTTELHNSRSPAFSSLVPTHHATLQLTPDHSGSSHTSAEGVEPSTMAFPELSPHLTVSQWGNEQSQTEPHTFTQSGGQYGSAGYTETHGNQFSTQQATQHPQASGDDEGVWRAGLDPDSRTDAEVPSLKQQEEQRRIDIKNYEVQEWRSQAGGSSDADEEKPHESYFDSEQAGPNRPRDPAEEYNNIPEVDDAASIRENQLQDGQVYYNLKDLPKTKVDEQLMSQPRHWNDAPSLPYMTLTSFQPTTSDDAMRRWNANADTISITSRAATWGTRRRSEPSLLDYDAVADGSFLKKLTIKHRDGERRQSSIFDQGLDRIANIVRKRSDAKLKRARSTQNIPQDAQNVLQPRHNSQGTLAPPPRTSSFGRRPTPSINTAIGAMTGSLGAVGNPHARSSSVSGAPTSPKSPTQTHLSFARSVITRVRSRSELTSHDRAAQTGLVGLWRGQGGPPVANLAASPPLETDVRPPQQKPKPKPQPQPQPQPEIQDQDEDEDEDDEPGDDGDMKIESEQESEPIVPNYEGFKAHVRRLNPVMDPRYNWLVSRIAHQQEIRYKNLLDLRVKHSQAIMNQNCGAQRHCVALGGNATLLDAKGNPRDSERNTSGLQLVTDFSDDSNPGEGALTDETFPQGVPMPPSRNLPAEFECQLCFKAKKFQKPSDWTKHVHEDVQPFTCTYDKCKEPKSFKRKADWVRHENERHRHLEWWICQVDDCRHPCYRKDNFLQHLVREHKLPEPKQKTKAAIKKAHGTEPAWIMLEQCHHETQNKPQDEPCKFCGKSFNTWKKLTVHLAKHMEHISLPILQLVDLRNVDANTIISPVEQILTPVTPISRAKMEPSHSPFNMDSISPHIPVVQQFSSGFDQSNFYPTTGPPTGYSMHAPVPQEVTYDQNPMYPNEFGVHPMGQPRGFVPMGNDGLNNMNQARQFGSIDSNFSHTKVEQPRQFGSMDSGFSNTMPDHNYNLHQTSGFTVPQNYASAPPVTSGYQAPNMLGISQAGFDFNTMAVNGGQPFQQVPMSRAQGSASSFGHSPQNVPNYYGHQS